MEKLLKIIITGLCVMAVLSFASCSVPPESFIKGEDPHETLLKISGEYTYQESWQIIHDYIQSRYDIQTEKKSDGFLETAWIYPTIGKVINNYRNKLTIQFSPDRYSLTITSEAEFWKHGILGIDLGWLKGRDDAFDNEFVEFLNNRIGRIP